MEIVEQPKVTLVWNTPDPRRVIALAARMTYSSKDVSELGMGLEEPEIEKSVNAILERRHYSVLRHVSFMFAVEGVSRAFSHQLVRHHAGHDYEQRSQHYRKETGFRLVVPRMNNDKSAKQLYKNNAMSAQHVYDLMIENGIPREDARFVLPNGVETQLVWTANLNALVNFVQQRACRMNTEEIMSVAIQVRRIVCGIIPEMQKYLGPTCLTQGICFEGEKFYKACNLPWRTPTVLWSDTFPAEATLVGVGGEKMEVNIRDMYKEFARKEQEEEND